MDGDRIARPRRGCGVRQQTGQPGSVPVLEQPARHAVCASVFGQRLCRPRARFTDAEQRPGRYLAGRRHLLEDHRQAHHQGRRRFLDEQHALAHRLRRRVFQHHPNGRPGSQSGRRRQLLRFASAWSPRRGILPQRQRKKYGRLGQFLLHSGSVEGHQPSNGQPRVPQ